jgi:virginiamycin B lyase
VGRANLDGTASEPAFIDIGGGTSPCGVATTATHIYWADINDDLIGRANIDGTGVDPDFINTSGTGDEPCHIAIDDNFVYWTNRLAPGGVARAELDGDNPEQLVNTVNGASGVAVNDTHVFWGDLNSASIGRANLDGGSPNPGFISLSAFPEGVAIDATFIYAVIPNPVGGNIARVPIGGGGFDFIPTGVNPCGAAVNAAHIYFANGVNGTIGRANIDGSDVAVNFIPGADSPCGVGLDSFALPTCEHLSRSTGADQAVTVTLDCSGTPPLTYAIASQPSHGQISGFNPSSEQLTYTPDPGFAGTDTFTYRGTNEFGNSSPASVSVEVASPPPPPPPPPPAPPSNDFAFGNLERNERRGTAKLTVEVPGPGALELGGKRVKAASEQPDASGDVALPIKARGKAKKRLRRDGREEVTVQVTYTPAGGESNTEDKPVKLIRRR